MLDRQVPSRWQGLPASPEQRGKKQEQAFRAETIDQASLVVPFHAPRSAHELKMLIVKLRWVGMESEADQLCRDLAELAPDEVVACLAGETD